MLPTNHRCTTAADDAVALRVLVAAQLPLERDALTQALTLIRPNFITTEVAPEDLDREIVVVSPHVVICCELTDTIEMRVPVWLVLRPYGAQHSIVSICGSRVEHPVVDLDSLVDTLDRAHQILR